MEVSFGFQIQIQGLVCVVIIAVVVGVLLTKGELVATRNEFVRPGCWKSCMAAAVYSAITSRAVKFAPIMPKGSSESAAAAAAATTTATMWLCSFDTNSADSN